MKVRTIQHRSDYVLCRVYTCNLTLVNIAVSMRYTIECCMQKYRSSVKQSALTTLHQSMQDSPNPSLPSRNHTQTWISPRLCSNLPRVRFVQSVAEYWLNMNVLPLSEAFVIKQILLAEPKIHGTMSYRVINFFFSTVYKVLYAFAAGRV